MASVIRDLMDHLGMDRATLVGQSLGGGVVMQFAYQFPTAAIGWCWSRAAGWAAR